MFTFVKRLFSFKKKEQPQPLVVTLPTEEEYVGAALSLVFLMILLGHLMEPEGK